MSAFTAYSAHAELVTAVHAHDEAEMLAVVHGDLPGLTAYPVSGDMLAVVTRAPDHVRRARRKRAAAARRAEH